MNRLLYFIAMIVVWGLIAYLVRQIDLTDGDQAATLTACIAYPLSLLIPATWYAYRHLPQPNNA